MCGRYTLVRVEDVIEKFPWIEHPQFDWSPRYNIAPSQPVLAVANDQPTRLVHLAWGLVPSWAKDPSVGNRMINARAETLADKPSFRTALKRRRCLVLADGFYEWQSRPGQKVKTPMLIRMRDHKPFAFAGLWDHWHGADGSEIRSCTIITTTPNELMRPIHDRMPAILAEDAHQAWLVAGDADPAAMARLLGPHPADAMEAMDVSRYVNAPGNEGPKCVEPVESEGLF